MIKVFLIDVLTGFELRVIMIPHVLEDPILFSRLKAFFFPKRCSVTTVHINLELVDAW